MLVEAKCMQKPGTSANSIGAMSQVAGVQDRVHCWACAPSHPTTRRTLCRSAISAGQASDLPSSATAVEPQQCAGVPEARRRGLGWRGSRRGLSSYHARRDDGGGGWRQCPDQLARSCTAGHDAGLCSLQAQGLCLCCAAVPRGERAERALLTSSASWLLRGKHERGLPPVPVTTVSCHLPASQLPRPPSTAGGCTSEHHAWPLSPLVQLYSAGHARRTDLLLLLGAAHYQLGQYRECVAANDQAILLDPSLAEVRGWGRAGQASKRTSLWHQLLPAALCFALPATWPPPGNWVVARTRGSLPPVSSLTRPAVCPPGALGPFGLPQPAALPLTLPPAGARQPGQRAAAAGGCGPGPHVLLLSAAPQARLHRRAQQHGHGTPAEGRGGAGAGLGGQGRSCSTPVSAPGRSPLPPPPACFQGRGSRPTADQAGSPCLALPGHVRCSSLPCCARLARPAGHGGLPSGAGHLSRPARRAHQPGGPVAGAGAAAAAGPSPAAGPGWYRRLPAHQESAQQTGCGVVQGAPPSDPIICTMHGLATPLPHRARSRSLSCSCSCQGPAVRAPLLACRGRRGGQLRWRAMQRRCAARRATRPPGAAWATRTARPASTTARWPATRWAGPCGSRCSSSHLECTWAAVWLAQL